MRDWCGGGVGRVVAGEEVFPVLGGGEMRVRGVYIADAVVTVKVVVVVGVFEGGFCADRNDGFVGVERVEAGTEAGVEAVETLEVEDVEEGDEVTEAAFDVDVAVDEGEEFDLQVGGGGIEGEEEGEDVVHAAAQLGSHSHSLGLL